MITHRSSFPRFRAARLVAAIALASFAAFPVSGRADVPTPLASGPNTGSADSFQGPHDWTFRTTKGTFAVAIVSLGDGNDTVPLNSAFTYKISFTPHIAPHAYSFAQTADGFSFHGRVATPTAVVVRIIPARSGLVRVARTYTIEASGEAVSYTAPSVDPIVGTYVDMSHGHGAVRFAKNGTVVCADGTQGTWVVFDPALRIYTVTVGSDRASVKFVPGRGLLDRAGGGNSLYDAAH